MSNGQGWSNCGCSTIYTDAYGNVINGPNSGADGTPATTPCDTNWGLWALAAIAGVVAAHFASRKKS